jgi:hypothetical protein
MDGKSMPQIYLTSKQITTSLIEILTVLNEILAMTTGATPSAVTRINELDAVTFMNLEADKGLQQDPDAAFNTVMFNPALDFTPGLNVRGFFAG